MQLQKMTREIKFRGKSIETGDWVYGSLWIREQDGKGTPGYLICEFGGKTQLVDSKTVGQFTGLKDKNGKEIYEGDILGYPNRNIKRIVKFGRIWIDVEEYQQEAVCFFTTPNNEINSDTSFLELNDIQEIIGNIYENPELLN